jgi:hypothetical protein
MDELAFLAWQRTQLIVAWAQLVGGLGLTAWLLALLATLRGR